jgi:hypothetical protein
MADWKLPRREDEFEIRWPAPVRTPAQAARFLEHVGFCVLFPVRNVPLPSLYFAVSRRREARWDKCAQLIWKWKDELPQKRRAFYAKYFRGRGTFLSPRCLALLLAAHETATAPDSPEDFYSAGRISRDACDLWNALTKHGPLATLDLRHACKLETPTGNKRFKKAMLELQGQLIVTHSGTEQETDAWASNRFDLVSRVFPGECRAATELAPEAARKGLAAQYQALYPSASAAAIARLFGWTKAQATSALSL